MPPVLTDGNSHVWRIQCEPGTQLDHKQKTRLALLIEYVSAVTGQVTTANLHICRACLEKLAIELNVRLELTNIEDERAYQ